MKYIVFVLTLVAFLLSSGSVQAREGSITLRNGNVACEAISVWDEDNYRVMGRCEGLTYPYQSQYEYYVLWAHEENRDNLVRINDVDRGFFQGNVNNPFDRLVITAETDDSPRRPSQFVVAQANVERFAFDRSQAAPTVTPTPTPAPTGQGAPATQGVNVGRVIGRILTALLVILLVIVAVVIVGSLIFRRRGSVSS